MTHHQEKICPDTEFVQSWFDWQRMRYESKHLTCRETALWD